jgi:hypothetical protein
MHRSLDHKSILPPRKALRADAPPGDGQRIHRVAAAVNFGNPPASCYGMFPKGAANEHQHERE